MARSSFSLLVPLLLLLAVVAPRPGFGKVCNTMVTAPCGERLPPTVPIFGNDKPADLRFGGGGGGRLSVPSCGAFAGRSRNVTTVFGVIGDFGLSCAACEAEVAALVDRVEQQFGDLDFLVTTGDNNYWDGGCNSLDANIGQYYSRFYRHGERCVNPTARDLSAIDDAIHQSISSEEQELRQQFPVTEHPVPPNRGKSKNKRNRFFPCLGNHDWDTYQQFPRELPYFQYFDYLTKLEPSFGHGQFYTATPHPHVQLFSLNSNLGTAVATKKQKQLFRRQNEWLKTALESSKAPFKIVYFHHPPYATAQHDPLASWMKLPYFQWGASIVMTGHQHVYERMMRSDGPYVVNGLGGHPYVYDIFNCDTAEGSQVRYNAHHGFMVGIVSQERSNTVLDFCFYSVENSATLVDHFQLHPKGSVVSSPLSSAPPSALASFFSPFDADAA